MAAGPLTNVNLSQLLKDFGSNVWSEMRSVLSAIGDFVSNFFGDVNEASDDLQAMLDDFTEIKENVKAEIQKIKDFRLQPHLKTRVINVPIAIDQIHDFVDLLKEAFIEKIQGIVDPIHDMVVSIKAEAATFTDQNKPSALARVASTSKEVVTTIHLMRQAFDSAKDFTELANQITDLLEGLDPLFLQQGNPRQKGSQKTMRVR